MTKTICTNMFLEEDGYCNRCSSYHFKVDGSGSVVTTRKSNPETYTSPTPKKSVEQTIRETPEFRIAKETVELLADIYGVEVKVLFRNCSGAYHTKKYGDHTIVFGYSFLRSAFNTGYLTSYKSIQWVQNFERKSGENGVKELAAHEFAHVLQTRTLGGRTYGSVHNQVFVEKWQEVLELVN